MSSVTHYCDEITHLHVRLMRLREETRNLNQPTKVLSRSRKQIVMEIRTISCLKSMMSKGMIVSIAHIGFRHALRRERGERRGEREGDK